MKSNNVSVSGGFKSVRTVQGSRPQSPGGGGSAGRTSAADQKESFHPKSFIPIVQVQDFVVSCLDRSAPSFRTTHPADKTELGHDSSFRRQNHLSVSSQRHHHHRCDLLAQYRRSSRQKPWKPFHQLHFGTSKSKIPSIHLIVLVLKLAIRCSRLTLLSFPPYRIP